MENNLLPITNAAGVDITLGVQVCYDSIISSMDWGSGFLDEEEMIAIIELALAMGWEVPDLQDVSYNSPAWRTFAEKHPEWYEVKYLNYTKAEVERFTEWGRDMPVRYKIVKVKK